MPDNPLLNPRRTAEMARFNMRLANLGETRRFRRLDRLWAYYIGAQHLVRGFDWDGRKVQGEGNEPDWISAAFGTNQFNAFPVSNFCCIIRYTHLPQLS